MSNQPNSREFITVEEPEVKPVETGCGSGVSHHCAAVVAEIRICDRCKISSSSTQEYLIHHGDVVT